MKIIVPFDPETMYSTEDVLLLALLRLDSYDVLNQVLSNWNKYTKQNAKDAYEQTIDDMYERVQNTMNETEIDQAESILDENSDQLAEIVRMSALHLHPLLKEIPEELAQMCRDPMSDEQAHTFLRVLEIKPECRIAVLTTDVTYL
jgi:glutamyl-tRNA reductase